MFCTATWPLNLAVNLHSSLLSICITVSLRILILHKPFDAICSVTRSIKTVFQCVSRSTVNAGVSRAAKCVPEGVACFSSESPISGQQWPSAIKDNHVLVMTVQALLNMLEDGDATLQAFDLMVSQLAVASSYPCGLS